MSTEIELELLKQKVESLELQVKFLNENWIRWTKDTKETGQKLMIALSNLVKEKK